MDTHTNKTAINRYSTLIQVQNIMEEFNRIKRLPPYVFATVNELKMKARQAGEDIIDLGMGNPDLPTPQHIVDKASEALYNPRNHRYSVSRGVPNLREAICEWYERRFNVTFDPEGEAIATIGAKEGLSHLALATIDPGDVVFVPSPAYPIHPYSVIIAGGDLRSIPLSPDRDFFDDLQAATKLTWPRPKMMILSFPHNPTTTVIDLDFFQKIVDYAKENNILIVHDFAYADLIFDGYRAPSIMEVDGARDVAVEFISLSKSYSMAGWRVGFCVGNKRMIHALTRIKSYLDYGMFQPLQIAAITALRGDQGCVTEIVNTYRERRDVLCEGLNRIGWEITKPKATMFAWAKIPEQHLAMGSLEFAKKLIRETKVAISPGIGFGEYGDEHVRFALVENEHRIRQAIRGLRKIM